MTEAPVTEAQRKAETRLDAAIRLSGIVKKHFPVPEGMPDTSSFVGAEYEEKKIPDYRRWELKVYADGRFTIRDILPIPTSLHAGGFTQEYTINPNGTPSLVHKNELKPGPETKPTDADDIADTEKALNMFLPQDAQIVRS